ncbi:MAG: hypothetical protein HYX78_01730 [Armatimonadetes bacterium]|nr:hypothetical protein [Armatimonadota bacterium]
MEIEYQALRQEILEWQKSRFTVAGGTVAVVTAFLGWVVTAPDKWSWEVAALLPLAFLTSACYMTWLFARFNAMIGTYLEVFHNSLWEKKSREFRDDCIFLRLNGLIAGMYLSLGIICLVLPHAVCRRPTSAAGIILLVLVLSAFATGLAGLAFRSYPRSQFEKKWQAIRDARKGSNEEL